MTTVTQTRETLIALDKLKKSPRNVRQQPHTKEEIEQLAASIASVGLIQNLVVEPELEGEKRTGFYLVTAGEGRRLAHLVLAKRKQIKPNAKIRCVIEDGSNAREISLAENTIRSDMHPADQYAAFAKLHHDEKIPVEDIAAKFGVTPAVVTQRLKLGSVSPKLIKAYRAGEMSLEQLTAFTITDDFKAQERVWKQLPSFNRSRRTILEALTETQVPGDDRRALYIGAEAYEAAGGKMLRDLFDPEGPGFFDNPELLDRLVREKLQRAAKKVVAEGWKWISVDPAFDHEAAAGMRRITASLSSEDQEKLDALNAQLEALYESEEEPSEETEAIEAQIAAIEERERFAPDDVARAGAFICLGHRGETRIERGFVRKEDIAPAGGSESGGEKEAAADPQIKGLSEKLITELTAARTSALRNELGKSPEAALTVVLQTMVLQNFYLAPERSPLELRAHTVSLRHHNALLDESRCGREIAARHAEWEKRFPEDEDGLWDFLSTLPADERLALLAHCASLTLNAVDVGKTERSHRADRLAKALTLDMTAYWQPTAANYLGRVSKERLLEALREGVSPEAARNLASLKKQAMAEAAEQRLDGKGWLPALLLTA